MYVCICNAVKEADLRGVARGGARDATQAYAAIGVEVCCAQCLEFAQEIIDDEMKSCLQTG